MAKAIGSVRLASLRGFGCGLALSWLLAAPAIGAEPTSNRISSDAVLYAEIPHPGVLLDRASDERLRALVDNVPGLRQALGQPQVATLRGIVTEASRRLGKPWDATLRELTGGGAVVAVEAPALGAPAVLLVVRPNDPAFLEEAAGVAREIIREKAGEQGGDDPIRSGEYRGITGYTLRGAKAGYAIVDGALVITDRGDTLKAYVDRALDGLPEDRSIASVPAWKARKDAATGETLAWGFARLDRLRELDPKRYGMEGEPDAGANLLFGGWLRTLREAPWVAGSVAWTESKLAAELAMPAPSSGRSSPFAGYLPPAGEGAPPLLKPPGTVLSVSLWRDLAAIWEAKGEIFRPEEAQGFNQLDTVAGQFFGGREFGPGVLGSLTNDWRLVVALQDHSAMNPVPDLKLPAFALVAELKDDDGGDFGRRLKVAFQSFVGVANIGAAQSKAPPLELLSETYEGVTLSTTRFMSAPPLDDAQGGPGEPVHYRQNFTPTAAQVGRHFVLSSSVGLARDLVKSLKASTSDAPKDEKGTLVARADGSTLARLVEMNRERLVLQNVLEKGNEEARAGAEVDLLAALLRYLGEVRLDVEDGRDLLRINLDSRLGR